MRVLVTGHDGYIGTVLVPILRGAGHEVGGLDAGLFSACAFGAEGEGPDQALRADVRDVSAADLRGFDAVVHLANLSNDPLGALDEDLTYAINLDATVRLAALAREAGVGRFVFASSCSLYGAAGQDDVDETAPMNPVTAYGRAKALAEDGLRGLATDTFSPVYLRNATVYGLSPRLRFDLVVNNLTAWAVATGAIRMTSDGSPWRPLVHVEDASTAVLAALEAPRSVVHNRAFNVGREGENYQVRDVARLVGEAVPGCEVSFAEGAGPDTRSYRVSFGRIARELPSWRPRWTVPEGIAALRDALAPAGLSPEVFEGPRYGRLAHLLRLREEGALGPNLRWTAVQASAQASPAVLIPQPTNAQP